MTITIRDVAKHLNLSITTVSRALDGYDDVAEETRQLVTQAALEMGYSPNRAARQLRRQRTDTIGYIIPANTAGFSDPFFSEFIAGLGDEASAHNFDLLVSTAPPASLAEMALYRRWVQGGKVGGMVVNRIYEKDWRLEYLAVQKIAHVSLERSSSQADFVGIEADSVNSMQDLIAHLVVQGRSKIAYIGGLPDLIIDRDRFTGYKLGLKSAGLPFNPHLVAHADLTREGGYQVAKLLLLAGSNQPGAIVCINDQTALGAMRAVHEAGLKVGQDIAVAGFDGIADSAYTQPPLTTLQQPVYNIARQLVTMLLALINGEPLLERQITILPKLLIRESTQG
jgi:LacI family transcriptional regulator